MSTNDPGMVPPPPPSIPDPADPPAPPFAPPVVHSAPGVLPQDAPTPASPYGAPAMPPASPGYGTPPSGGGKGLVVTALVLSLVALLLSWVPIINNVAAVLAVGALVMGVVGIVGATRKGRPGKGMAIASVVVSVVSLVVVVLTQVAYGLVIDELVDGIESSTTEQLEGAPQEPAASDEPVSEHAASAAEPAVVDLAFGQGSAGSDTWWYVVIVENPNPGHVFPFAEFAIEAVGADGTILDSDSSYVDLLPGRVALAGMFFQVGGNTVDHLEVRGPEATDAVEESDLGAFTVSDVAATSDDWHTTVGGNLSSSFAQEQTNVEVTVVARDAQGRIIGSDFTYVDRLPVGGQARFEASFFDVLPEGTTYEVYPNP